MNEALLAHKLRFTSRYQVQHLATIAALVASGLGLNALPELATRVAQRPGVVVRGLRAPVLRGPIGLVTPRNRGLSPAAQRIFALLKTGMAREHLSVINLRRQ